ncbi:ribbon-helix-helix protein, CopG family [Hyperthermus butylicus]|uniref:Conserved crenarchaeal protein n=1 Tax=Hyperthermus butylicus (strain DSM 5456 / JCM 9403 / PLM1-5) TaxID=415426 RepID=A2BN83_HYPBU|nr:ribbon-helix-helix protein, CopG family [Hyperthermus butylicus]ABM81444.1 conserved crenarchaeal protein [Hyperthermus butylicus DSM 5456]
MQRIVTFKIEEELLALLDRYAKSRRLTRSEVIREAIEKLLESEGIRVPKKPSPPRYDPRALVIEVAI